MNRGHNYYDLELEKYLLGELGAERSAEITRDAQLDTDLRIRLARMREEDERFPSRCPPDFLPKTPPFRIRSSRGIAPIWVAACVVVACVGVVFQHLSVVGTATHLSRSEEVTRLKGLVPQLSVFRAGEDMPRLIPDNGRVFPGDVLQIKYNAAGFRYGVIFSTDSVGHVSLHFPARRHDSAAMEAGDVAVPFAFRLDDSPGYERFVMVVSNAKLDAAQVMERAQGWDDSAWAPAVDNRSESGERLAVITLWKGKK